MMGRPKIEVPEDELRKLVDEGRRKSELAEHFGCSEGTIQNRAKEYGIELNSGKRKIRIPEDELRELYFDKGLNTKEIGERYGCSQDPVQREMKRHEIEPNRKKVSVDRERVRELYYGEEYSLADFSDELGHTEETIANRMDEWGMERRSKREAQKTDRYKKKLSEQNSGDDNPFAGREHSEETKQQMSENSGGSWEEKFGEETLKEQREHIKNLKYWEGEKRPEFSEKYSGEDHWHHGEELSEEHRRKIRKGVADHFNQNDAAFPNYNPRACEVIEEYGDKCGYDFQHAENGAEHHLESVGCWLDGYDPEANVVVEVYERHHHYNGGELKNKDKLREKLIIEKLNCEFVRIKVDRDGNVENVKKVSEVS